MQKENLHIHSEYSWDSNLKIEDIVKKARESSFGTIAITDHVEMYENVIGLINKYSIESERYKKIESLKKDIEILHGIELSEPHLRTSDIKLIDELPLDIVLGSIHDIDKTQTEEEKIIEAYKKYYLKVKNSVLAGNFDVLAHLGYIDRYYNYPYKNQDLLDEILNEIIRKQIALEINTSGLRRKTTPTIPKIDIIERYKKLGGEIVTIGSDAHREEEINDNIEASYDIAKTLKLRPVTYKNRRIR